MIDINIVSATALFEMVLFAVFGLGLEVVFTAVLDSQKDRQRHLIGYSSLWYLPIYMLAPLFLSTVGWRLFTLPLVLRGLTYMAVIFFIEYIAMFCLRKLLGASPSEASYYQSSWNIHGLIRLDYGPAMFLMGMIFEFVYRHLH